MTSRALVLVCWMYSVAASAVDVPVLAYHDLVRDASGDDYAVSESLFRQQMEYLRDQGYHPISLAAYARAAKGKGTLPAKPIMLTFDDGLASFKDIALPILAKFGYPAVLSVTTGWLDNQDAPDNYRGRLLTPETLKTISQSAHVEVLSHTDRLHQGIISDPQGSLGNAAVSRVYRATAGYENESAYRQRIRADLQRSVRRLTEVTGNAPTGIAWPYGDFNAILVDEASRLGLRAQLDLDDHLADTRKYPEISRLLVYKVKTLGGFEILLNNRNVDPPVRLLAVTLDDLSGKSPAQQEEWIQQLVSRVVVLRINAVLVDPVAADGRHVFFANPALPSRGDILHRVLYQLRRSAGIRRLYLKLSPPLSADAARHELARRHIYDGVVLADGNSAEHVDAGLKEFRYYRPGLRCGTLGVPATASCPSFRVIRVDAGSPHIEPAPSGPANPPTYYLVEGGDAAGSKPILRTLRALQVAGAHNLGLADAALLNDPATLRAMAIELARGVPRRPGG